MIQNGFRRIALAQGLLPERPASQPLPANLEPAAAPRLATEEAADPPAAARDGESELRLVAEYAHLSPAPWGRGVGGRGWERSRRNVTRLDLDRAPPGNPHKIGPYPARAMRSLTRRRGWRNRSRLHNTV
jgi:hypothetical protein